MYEEWTEQQLRDELQKILELVIGEDNGDPISQVIETFMHDSYLDMSDTNCNLVPLLIQLDTILNTQQNYEDEDYGCD